MGDLDWDGELDLAVANASSSDVSVLMGTGNGAFQHAVNYDVGAEPFSVDIGDLDWDGALDLVMANSSSNTVSVLFGNGDGSFQSPVY